MYYFIIVLFYYCIILLFYYCIILLLYYFIIVFKICIKYKYLKFVLLYIVISNKLYKMTDKVIFNVNNMHHEKFELDEEQTVKDLRNLILEKFDKQDMDCKIHVLIDRPIRSFSILTLNPGELTEVYDHERMNRFDILGRELNINVEFCEKKVLKPRKEYKSRFTMSYLNRYNNELEEETKNKTFVYKEEDFPPL